MAPTTLTNGNFEDFEKDLEALLREQHHSSRAAFDVEPDGLDIIRSGSAPPTVEGSRAAFGSLLQHNGLTETRLASGLHPSTVLTEEEMRSHPAYLSFYYSNEHLNPRLPLPAVSKEDWRVAQRFCAGTPSFGGLGDRKRRTEIGNSKQSGNSLFSLQPGIPMNGREQEMSRGALMDFSQAQSTEWLEKGSDGLIGLPDVGLGSRRKSFAGFLQEEPSYPSSVAGRLSRPTSRKAFENANSVEASDLPVQQICNGSELVEDLYSENSLPTLVRVKSIGSSVSHSFASAVGSSLSRSTTPDPLLIRRSPSPRLPPVGVRGGGNGDKKAFVGSGDISAPSSYVAEGGDITAAISAISSLSFSDNNIVSGEGKKQSCLRRETLEQPDILFNVSMDNRQYLQEKLGPNFNEESLKNLKYNGYSKNDGNLTNTNATKLASMGRKSFPLQSPHASDLKKVSTSLASSQGQNGNAQTLNFFAQGKALSDDHASPAMLSSQFSAGGVEENFLNLTRDQTGSGFQVPIMDPLYAQYMQTIPNSVVNAAAAGMHPSSGRNFLGSAYMDVPDYQESSLGALFPQKFQYNTSSQNKYSGSNHGYFGSIQTFGTGIPYPISPMSSFIPNLDSGSPMKHNEWLPRVSSISRTTGGSSGLYRPEDGLLDENYASSLLEELKNTKTRSFELLDIAGHVVEFSMDQYGSRFIQQKLETALVEEKNKIFPELLPQARALMTDVFGNYVIQKFFEHGTEPQRKLLASQLTGHVLQLSLQMYGCRVIQKALEVVDIEQQTQMVMELEGSIMKCVHDQNGNHVIQKCIECVPQDRIQFIISAFYGHVVSLSTHPYGCRVIQRVLEHCDDPKKQSIMMVEIMQSVCTLAQDQYGNYVIQHVLQHGKPEERSAIICQLAGQIVKMSQQKFASNVVEKCLTYGTPEERQLLINEMLGSTDENEPLQVMMKDQFANYVVQKVLETCDDENRELILSRIRVHLTALKRYTYGKHIVARVEKLIAAGERRSGLSSSYPS